MAFRNVYDAAEVKSSSIEAEKKMSPEPAKKSAHPICTCEATTGKYCSAACEAMEKTPDIDCHCAHKGCKGKTS
jgi:hypothetical protein